MKSRMFSHLTRLVAATAFAAVSSTAVLTTIAANAGAPAQGVFAAAPLAALADSDDHRGWSNGNRAWRDGNRANWSGRRDDTRWNDNRWRAASYDRDQRFDRDRDDRFNRGNWYGDDGGYRQANRNRNWDARRDRDDRVGRWQR